MAIHELIKIEETFTLLTSSIFKIKIRCYEIIRKYWRKKGKPLLAKSQSNH